MNALTEKQLAVLRCIAHSLRDNSPPTRQELANKLGFSSPNAAQQHLKALERKGMIALDETKKSRGIRLLAAGEEIVFEKKSYPQKLPVIGRVAAGLPILSETNIETYYEVNGVFQADYLLRVHGESMKEAGIFDGDLLAVKNFQGIPQNLAIVVARIEDEVTVKRFLRKHRNDPMVYLLPENSDPHYQPIAVDLRTHSLHIEGLGMGVIRQF